MFSVYKNWMLLIDVHKIHSAHKIQAVAFVRNVEACIICKRMYVCICEEDKLYITGKKFSLTNCN